MKSPSKIVFCSLLKPVDDTRMYEKLALSLTKIDNLKIFIIGADNGNIPKVKNITFLPIFKSNRTSVSRLLAPLKLLKYLIKLKPDIIINNSIDFLLVIILYKSLTRSKIIYDIQENYYSNIYHNRYVPAYLGWFLANSVRSLEVLSSWFTDHFLLAEKTYVTELKFIRNKYLLLENKYSDIFPAVTFAETGLKPDFRKIENPIKIIFSGTVADHYGIFEIVEFVKIFHSHYPVIKLEIVGYCPHAPTRKRLLGIINKSDFIECHTLEVLIPHCELIKKIRGADFGIIHYHINPSTENRFPTRIYEYMANLVPVLIQDHKPWSDFISKWKAGIVVDFTKVDFDVLYHQMRNEKFFISGLPDRIFWREEADEFRSMIENL